MTKPNLGPIDTVLFDWGGTLATWRDIDLYAVWRSVATLIDEARADDLAAKLVAAEEAAWLRSRDEHVSSTLEDVCLLADVVMTPAALAEYERLWHPHTELDPDAIDLLTDLRNRGYRIGVLSNTIWSRQRHEQIFARDGVLDLIDGAVYTSEVPWTKPHPEAFLAAMRAAGGTEPARCVFVGDRLFDDVWGAQNVGMRAVHVPHSAIPANQIGHTEGIPDATVHRLAELSSVLESWK
ncbi:HAD-superfamily hydrolase, subfamily IA, variant 3 [Kribbella flavida DSM 17836]|uniref:HAD-superfamily hydrolase, subfamily IA, variant 3 n=1 Tax=Kribbella flavida (strain DSM 17836 / JCM 10339 / NBRC 14399) TaxID=479435 RepID=D2PL02_KRIFD|nr:HAD family hydrolase [Kribbella flavida]ADB32469.1 HAD-superfamily hydrolase, subfamily IA, variant 3 [Kribbella flavida DSM 17836]